MIEFKHLWMSEISYERNDNKLIDECNELQSNTNKTDKIEICLD